MNRILAAIFATCLWTSAQAADSWHIGMNNLFIQDYLLNQSVGCPTGLTCPNRQSISLSNISTWLSNWATSTTGHMGMYREIVGMAWVAPTCASSTCSDNTNWSKIDAVLDQYEGYDLYLILTLGNPIPAWADSYASNTSGQCWLPSLTDSTDWTTVKDNIAWAMGNYYNHYAGLSSARKTWLESHVTIEGFNELDAPQANDGTCTGTDGGSNAAWGTPTRNADLVNGIGYVVNYYGLTANYAMASLGGVYNGTLSHSMGSENDVFQYYVADYYSNSGSGAPNIHAYVAGDGTESNIKSITEGYISAACTGAGSSHCSSLIFGEYGWNQQVTGVCSGGFSLPDSIRNNIFADFASDSNIGGKVNMMTLWQSVQYADSQGLGCAGRWGIINHDGTSSTAATNLFNWLEAH